MKKINLNDVVNLIKGNPHHWAQNILYITTSKNTVIINDCPKEKYDLIILKSNEGAKELEEDGTEKKVINFRGFKESWQDWETDLVKKYKGDYSILKNMLPHRTKASIKTKCTRLFSGSNI